MTERRAAAHLAAFLLPCLLLLAVYASMGMWPWGDKTILASDMADQYVEFFCALKHGDVYFSWSKALGSSYIGVFSYYVSSPLSLLTLLVPNEYMPCGLMFLCCLKVGLIGLSFSLFYRRRFGRVGAPCLLFSLCYALCSYVAAYSLCIMWLDGLIWLPIILLALDRLLTERRGALLTAALSLCFLSTWYISYMIGGFCLLWLLCSAARGEIPLRAAAPGPVSPAFTPVCPRPSSASSPDALPLPRALLALVQRALLALMLTSPVWLPSFLAMFSGKLSDATADYPSLVNLDLSFFKQFLPGQYSSITSSALPYIFSGTIVTLLAIVYFFLKPIPVRRRAAMAALICVLILSMSLSPLDKVWHLFKFPNWFPFRYAFLLSFTLIFTAAEAAQFVFPRLPRLVSPALLLLTAAELALNTSVILRGIDSQFHYESFQSYYQYYTETEALVQAAEQDDSDSFCRIGATDDRGFNSPLSFGYPGITHYSSLYSRDVNSALKSLGLAQSWMWSACYGSTPLTDALFGVKYVISPSLQPLYEPLVSAGQYWLWKSGNSLPLAFLAASAPPELSSGSPIERQNELFRALSGTGTDVFSPVIPQVTHAGGSVTLSFTGSGRPIYADLSAYSLEALYLNGQFVTWLNTDETRSVHLLACPASGETAEVTITGSAAGAIDWSSACWELDSDALSELCASLDNTGGLSVDGAAVCLSYSSQNSRVLATTIPAEPGWRAYLDGERVETGELLGAFITVQAPAGEHSVAFRYTPPGLPLSLLLAAASLPLIYLVERRKKGR